MPIGYQVAEEILRYVGSPFLKLYTEVIKLKRLGLYVEEELEVVYKK